MNDKNAVAIIVAAGQGKRMGAGQNKLLLSLGNSTIFELSLKPFLQHSRIRKIFVTASQQDRPEFERLLLAADVAEGRVVLVEGGERRQDSVHRALLEIRKEKVAPELILVHDGARPFCSKKLIDLILQASLAHGAAVPVLPLVDTIRRITPDKTEVVNRNELFAVQTPQGFRTELLQTASSRAVEQNWEVSDDASLPEKSGHRVATVEGEPHNLKITTPADLEYARRILKQGLSNGTIT